MERRTPDRARPEPRNELNLTHRGTNPTTASPNRGGYSLYAYNGRHKAQGRRGSFDRPLSSQFDRWERAFVEWAEKNGYAMDYCVNSDLEFRPELLKPYKLVLSVGHDEYWSWEMRDHIAGMNAGRWDYIFSAIKKFRHRSDYILPDRSRVTMTVPFMRAYTDLLVKTCHRRGAHAMGGMAAFIPSRRDAAANCWDVQTITHG